MQERRERRQRPESAPARGMVRHWLYQTISGTVAVKAMLLLAVSVLLMLGGAGGTVSRAASSLPDAEETIQGSGRKTRILLIGNSYTARNNMPEMLEKICEAKGHRVKVVSVTKRGACLKYFASTKTAVGKKVHRLLKNNSWDYVILQERHYFPLANVSAMKKAICALQPYVEDAGAELMLYMTWAPEEGHSDYVKYKSCVSDREEYQRKIAISYEKAARASGAVVIPVGIAFQNALMEEGTPALNGTDRSHPTKYGSYLAACTIYAAIFDESPEGASISGVKKGKAELLQQISWETWKKK